MAEAGRYHSDDPIFISTLEKDLESLKKGLQAGDVAMMQKRLHVFRFQSKIEALVEIPACGRCFAEFLLDPAGVADGGYPPRGPFTPRDGHGGDGTSGPKRPAGGPTGETPDAKRGATSAQWSEDAVCSYLASLELGHLCEGFRANGVDGAMLCDLSEADLQTHLGLLPLQARKVKQRLPR